MRGQHMVGRSGPSSNAWRGGRIVTEGKVLIFKPEHPCAIGGKYVSEHRIVVEKAIGKLIPPKAVIHHVDGNPHNNNNTNLVLCDSHAYHLFIHTRTRAYLECGDPSWLSCRYCKKYDSPDNLYVKRYSNGNLHHVRHRKCHAEAEHKRKYPNKESG